MDEQRSERIQASGTGEYKGVPWGILLLVAAGALAVCLLAIRKTDAHLRQAATRDMLGMAAELWEQALRTDPQSFDLQLILARVAEASLATVYRGNDGRYKDGWGREFVVEESSARLSGPLVVVRSVGADGILNTADDIVVHFGVASGMR